MLIARSKSKPDTIALNLCEFAGIRENVLIWSNKFDFFFFSSFKSTLSQRVKARNSFREAEPYDNDWISGIPRQPFISLYKSKYPYIYIRSFKD